MHTAILGLLQTPQVLKVYYQMSSTQMLQHTFSHLFLLCSKNNLRLFLDGNVVYSQEIVDNQPEEALGNLANLVRSLQSQSDGKSPSSILATLFTEVDSH